MKILWLTWKDLKHPLAGGAEVVNEELAKRLAADGHEVTFVVGGFRGASAEEIVNGYKVVRLGNRYSVYWLAYRYYKRHLRGWADLVIDEVNTMPFFAKFYVREPNVVLAYMLCRKIWFYQLPLPFSLLGYLAEPLYLRLLRDRKVLTESQSAKDDLVKSGFKAENINIFSVGIEMKPLQSLDTIKKYSQPTLLSLGAIRPMKRTADQIKTFERVKRDTPDAQLKVAGDATGLYGQKILKMIAGSRFSADIEYLGKVSRQQKIELMQKCHLIMVTSVKEGWGLIVTEAASQGTPAVVYDVDGLRDSVQNDKTGLVAAHNTPEALAASTAGLLQDPDTYDIIRKNAWRWSKDFIFERSYREFKQIIS